MKNKNLSLTLKSLVLLTCITFLNSCQKDLDLTDDVTAGEMLQDGSAKIRFINAAPEVGAVSLKFNGNNVQGDSLYYKNFTGYTDVALGSVDNGFTMDMHATLDSSNNNPNNLVEFWTPNNSKEGIVGNFTQTNFLLKKDEKYVCFVVDAMLTDGLGNPFPFSNPIYLVGHKALTENYVAPAGDSCMTRFYQLSSTTEAVDLYFTNTSNNQITVLSNITFLQYPTYNTLFNGNYNIEVQQAGAVLASRNNVDLATGKAYTFYLRGIKTAADDKQLQLEYFTNGE